MRVNDQLTEAEIIAWAERLDDDRRRDLIARLAALGTDQYLRIASWLIGLSLSADVKTRSTVH
jgi:hypothetical protein